jgi:hypothetical protein
VVVRVFSASAVVASAIALGACGFGNSMSTTQVAAYFQRTFPMQSVTCTTKDTAGWKYACSFTDPQGARRKIGVDLHNGKPFGSGTVPVNDALPPHS